MPKAKKAKPKRPPTPEQQARLLKRCARRVVKALTRAEA